MTLFAASVREAAREHARQAWPEEACGLVTAAGYVPCSNVAPRRTNARGETVPTFAIADAVYLDHDGSGGGVKAVIHSHTQQDPWPSRADMEGQLRTGVPWGLCLAGADGTVTEVHFWGDMLGVPAPPGKPDATGLDRLIGRDFRHGPSGTDGKGDCFALVRDYYRLILDIALPEFPRDDRWWDDGLDMYADGFERAGGVCYARGPELPDGGAPQEHDVVLMNLYPNRLTVPHHAGVVLKGGLLLHHKPARQSITEPLFPWTRYVTHWLRYRTPLAAT